MSEILLIQPPTPTPNRVHTKDSTLSAPPIALGYLASLLIESGYDVDIVDMEILDMGGEEIFQLIAKERPRLVGLSTTTLTYKNALRVAAIVKELNQETVTVLGGPHVTFTAEEALSYPQIDFVIRGEGEKSLLALTRFALEGYGNVTDVGGLSFTNTDSKVVHNPRQGFICYLDSLPFPTRHLFPLHLYSAPGLIITGRGCEGRCIFCAARGISGGRYRFRSVDNVIKEIEVMVSLLGFKFFFFGDDTFTADAKRTRAFCQALQKSDFKINWICETRADTVDRATLQAMVDAGCKIVQFGVESGSQKVLDMINKGIKIANLRKAVKTALDVGLSPTCSFMIPHPNDNWETIKETKALMKELQSTGVRMAVALTTPFPGTYLANHLADFGMKIVCDDTDKYNFSTPILETKTFDTWDIREIYFDMVMLCLHNPKPSLRPTSQKSEIETNN